MEIYKTGTEILVGGSIKAHITAACIREENVIYEVEWLHDYKLITCWLKPFQFTINVKQKDIKTKIGFKP